MKPNPAALTHALESFSLASIDGIEMVKAKAFPFSPALDAAREYTGREVAPDTLIVRFEDDAENPEHVELCYFRREDLFDGEVNEEGALVAEDLSGAPATVTFFVGGAQAKLI